MPGTELFSFSLEQFSWFLSSEFLNLRTLLFAVSCYVYASVPFAIIFTYLFKKEALSQKGSTNIGVANAFGVGGLRVGFATVATEISKAMLPLSLAHFFYDGELASALVLALATILGAHFSIFLRGKGGRATTILLWLLLILSPFSFLLFGAVFVILIFTTKRQYLTAIVGYALLPLELFLIEGNAPFALFGLLASLIYCVRYDRSKSDVSFYSRAGRFMMPSLKRKYLVELSGAKKPMLVGLKASKLHFLKKLGLKVPNTWVCTFEAYENYLDEGNAVIEYLSRELAPVIREGKKYSVRSSANIEDEQDYSFAGQFDSYLNVDSLSKITDCIQRIWKSSNGHMVTTYLSRADRSGEDIKMAAIIEEMIEPEFSGVVFTKNPVNSMDEVIVEVVHGVGESMVQAGVTPDRYVYKWGNWLEKPEAQESVPPLIDEIVSEAKSIAKRYGRPVDLEWAYDGKDLYWLQLREITTLRGVNVYSNRISKEFLPGIIKPLVWSVNILIVNSSWKRLFVEMVGKAAKGIDINNLAKQFYYRAYFNMGVIGDIFDLLGIPRESIELIMGVEVPAIDVPRMRPGAKVIKYIPHMLRFAGSKLMYAPRLDKFCKAQKSKTEQLEEENIEPMKERETLEHIEQAFRIGSEASYHVIVSQLLMGLYNTILRRLLARKGIDMDGLHYAHEKVLLRDIDVDYHFAELHNKYQSLPYDSKLRLQEASFDEWSASPELNDFYTSIDTFITTFGHLGESSNDFSRPIYRENPEMLLNIIANYPEKARTTNESDDLNILPKGFLKGLFFRWVYHQTIKYRVYRQKVGYLYARVYSIFRSYFMHLGRLFTAEGYIETETDIFYLTYDEIKEIVQSNKMPAGSRASLMKRKRDIAKYKDITLPGLIIGDEVPIPHRPSEVSRKLKGLAVARGYYEGTIKIIKGIEDFGKVEADDIIVIPHSDVSWTPLFSKVKAVVSESGGMLSHSAIIAREYGIPAVVSVPFATGLHDGIRVVVNGNTGEVLVIE